MVGIIHTVNAIVRPPLACFGASECWKLRVSQRFDRSRTPLWADGSVWKVLVILKNVLARGSSYVAPLSRLSNYNP